MGYFFSLSKSAATVGFEFSEWMLLIFGGILVLGIFGEYKKLPKRLLLLWPTTVFEILVMVGVAGELLGDGSVFVFSSHLQSIEDQELSDMGSNALQLEARLGVVGGKVTQVETTSNLASTKSNDAEVRSSKAVETASKATKSATTALNLARGVRQEADTARKDAAEAKSLLSEVRTLAADARTMAAGAADKVADRILSSSQQAAIAAKIRPFGPQQVDVIIIGDSQEIGDLTENILAALQQGGWSTKHLWKAVAGPNISAVRIGTHVGADRNLNGAVEALVSAIASQGVGAGKLVPPFGDELPMALNGPPWDSKNIAPIRILVGAKP